MPVRASDILAQLDRFRSADARINTAVDAAQQMLKQTKTAGNLAGIKIRVCDFSGAEESLSGSVVYTENCKVILLIPVVIFNERFLKEVEAAIRSFAMSLSLLHTQYFQSDAGISGLVQRISNNPERYLRRLRGMLEDDAAATSAIAEELTMTIFYFISHEIGHLLSGEDQRHYGAFLDQDAPLEERIANAVVKMGMHMEDLYLYGFTLGSGLQADKNYTDIKSVADDLQATVAAAIANHPKWFQDEKEADERANQIVIEYLDKLDGADKRAADRMRHHLVRGLFAAGIYAWFRDLGSFLDKLGSGWAHDSKSLMVEMAKHRERYIQAASLFGDVHRFTLLRANLTIEAVLRATSSWFEEDESTRSIWYAREPVAPPPEFAELKKWRLAENLQRYYMLCILMDTAVKLAYVGYSTGWIKEMDKKRGTPQLFLMTFYSIPHELDLLKRMQ